MTATSTPAIPRDATIVVLTGAGVSKESGLSTFRDPDGIWATVRIEDVATPEAFARDPARVHTFYNARRRLLLDPKVAPNPAHHALARLEAGWPGEFMLVTQNIDNLHERAGSRNIRHIHGEMLKSRCALCEAVAECAEDLGIEKSCAACGRSGGLRPHVVWFGEMPFDLDAVYAALARCGLFVSIGTSGNVYPAAGFVAEARAAGSHTVELNLEPSAGGSLFAEAVYGPAGTVVVDYVERLLAGG